MTASTSDIAMLDVAEVRALGATEALIVDVRLPFDYFGGRLPGSINLPDRLLIERAGEIAPDTRLILVCDDGAQSAEVARDAHDAGFTHVAVLAGGLDAWLDADLPIETISDGTGSTERR